MKEHSLVLHIIEYKEVSNNSMILKVYVTKDMLFDEKLSLVGCRGS